MPNVSQIDEDPYEQADIAEVSLNRDFAFGILNTCQFAENEDEWVDEEEEESECQYQ